MRPDSRPADISSRALSARRWPGAASYPGLSSAPHRPAVFKDFRGVPSSGQWRRRPPCGSSCCSRLASRPGPALRWSRAVASADEPVCFHEESRARRPMHSSGQSCIIRREPRRQPSRQLVIGLCSTTGNLPLISVKQNRRTQGGDHAAPPTNNQRPADRHVRHFRELYAAYLPSKR